RDASAWRRSAATNGHTTGAAGLHAPETCRSERSRTRLRSRTDPLARSRATCPADSRTPISSARSRSHRQPVAHARRVARIVHRSERAPRSRRIRRARRVPHWRTRDESWLYPRGNLAQRLAGHGMSEIELARIELRIAGRTSFFFARQSIRSLRIARIQPPTLALHGRDILPTLSVRRRP